MWAIRAALLLLILLVIIAVTLLNNTQNVAFNLLFVRYERIPLIAVIYWSFLAGIIITIVLGLSYVFKLQSQLRRRGKEIKRLSAEVGNLNREVMSPQPPAESRPETKPDAQRGDEKSEAT